MHFEYSSHVGRSEVVKLDFSGVCVTCTVLRAGTSRGSACPSDSWRASLLSWLPSSSATHPKHQCPASVPTGTASPPPMHLAEPHYESPRPPTHNFPPCHRPMPVASIRSPPVPRRDKKDDSPRMSSRLSAASLGPNSAAN